MTETPYREDHPTGITLKLETLRNPKPKSSINKSRLALLNATRDLWNAHRKSVDECVLLDPEAWQYFLIRLDGWRNKLGVK